ncbi:helix-turn-helix domain-containing protein [Pontixanthobacter rizhaonensis]|uniref:helix-turn-helix domain-containing protein n=1 Tax=Pontixanthobacter rizhaonensis TaxID=2730337 RepID=UPI001FE63776|nr:helix-turn-helix transcriptional regulator [Pontixanthobacter rizhaonensis]
MMTLDKKPSSFSVKRTDAGLTLSAVANEFKVTEEVIKAWESGEAKPPVSVMRSLDAIGRYGGGSQTTPVPLRGKPQQSVEGSKSPPQKLQGTSEKALIKSKARVADHGEVFTPPWLVEKMLDLVKGETERIDSRFLEPACGSGNFLVPILQRKLAAVEAKYGKSDFEKKHYALLALTSLYGIELLADNIAECRALMLGVFAEYLGLEPGDDLYRAGSHVLSLNLIHGDAMSMKDADGGPITVAEWSSLGKGRFNRRDFRLDVLTGMAKFREERSLFSHLGDHEIFQPSGDHPPMTVRDMAALDTETDMEIGE